GSFTIDNDDGLGVNKVTVCGTIAARTEYSQIIAVQDTISANKEEYRLAVEAEDVINGTPVIALTVNEVC
ncbi:hypothetical protein BDFB_014396, partial [Asbolus verrucosus]